MSTQTEPPDTAPRWRLLGPGLVVAATGVGAADLVATLVAGADFGFALLWAVVLGCVLKVVLVEGVGRWTLATGSTLYEGWSTLGRWTSWYFAPYIVVWGFVYGAAAMAGSGLPLHSLFPALSVTAWGMFSGVLGLALVWSGRYALFEKALGSFVLLMFITMVGAAVLTLPNLGEVLSGLVPTLPVGSIVRTVSVAGGVGGTITLAAYGYWLREKGWSTPRFMKVMRLDNRVAYGVTGVFVVATLIVGAELLYSAQIAVSEGDEGLLDLSEVLQDRYGAVSGTVFLVGFWAAAMSSLVGVWNGVSLMFADYVGHTRGLTADDPARRGGGTWYRAYILWLTFPPMVMLFLGQPVWLITAYTVLGAFFMPFLAITLLWLLNTDRTPATWRNNTTSNVLMSLCAVFFLVLSVLEVYRRLAG